MCSSDPTRQRTSPADRAAGSGIRPGCKAVFEPKPLSAHPGAAAPRPAAPGPSGPWTFLPAIPVHVRARTQAVRRYGPLQPRRAAGAGLGWARPPQVHVTGLFGAPGSPHPTVPGSARSRGERAGSLPSAAKEGGVVGKVAE